MDAKEGVTTDREGRRGREENNNNFNQEREDNAKGGDSDACLWARQQYFGVVVAT